MGLSGSTGFSIKVSPDGNNWPEAPSFDPTSGVASGTAVQNSAEDTTAGRLMRADYGYGPGNLLGAVTQSDGTPTGAVIERGVTPSGDFVRFADGTQICTASLDATTCTNTEGALYASSSETWDFPTAFAAGTTPALSGSGGSIGRFIGFDGPTDTQAAYKILSSASDAAALPPSAIAIGRWF